MIRLRVADPEPIGLEVKMTAAPSGPAPVLITKLITENGVYQASEDGADGYRQVTADVANSYSAADEGKVVDNGVLVNQTARTITANGTYDTTINNSVTANIPNSYSAADEGKVVDDGALVSQAAKTITANGTYDTTKNNSVTAEVPNTYTAADEGKVVDEGALVSQRALSITANGTYDTTKNNSVTANVPNTYSAADEGKVVDDGALVSQTSLSVTENGTYDTTLNNEIVVNVVGDIWMEETITTSGAVTKALDPRVLYHFTGVLTSLTITFNAPSTGEIAHYHFDFLSGASAPTLTMPNAVTMPDDFEVEASNRYEVDVLNNFGAVITWTV